jgi:cytochrome c-type biogenesis protein CcmE
MKFSSSQIRIGAASVIILATIGYLAVTGAEGAKSYYVTVPEMQAMGEKAYHSNLRVEGYVKPASIAQSGPNVNFVLTEFESHNPKATASARAIKVDYEGTEPPPDTFKGDAQALAIGTWGRDGVFHATQLQAKCASKYAPAAPGQPASAAPVNDKRAAIESPGANSPAR